MAEHRSQYGTRTSAQAWEHVGGNPSLQSPLGLPSQQVTTMLLSSITSVIKHPPWQRAGLKAEQDATSSSCSRRDHMVGILRG
eukprot:SAG31_NODE_22988_length_513_cov_3.019324_1_plen_82_part_10